MSDVPTVFFLDWDVDYDQVKDTFLFFRLEQYLVETGGYAWIRRSPHGNTHVMVLLPFHLNTLEVFMARAYLGDDPFRIALDLKRMREGGAYDRLFDTKVVNGKTLHAGEWVAI